MTNDSMLPLQFNKMRHGLFYICFNPFMRIYIVRNGQSRWALPSMWPKWYIIGYSQNLLSFFNIWFQKMRHGLFYICFNPFMRIYIVRNGQSRWALPSMWPKWYIIGYSQNLLSFFNIWFQQVRHVLFYICFNPFMRIYIVRNGQSRWALPSMWPKWYIIGYSQNLLSFFNISFHQVRHVLFYICFNPFMRIYIVRNGQSRWALPSMWPKWYIIGYSQNL